MQLTKYLIRFSCGEAERPIGLLKKGACFLTIAARDPENLKGVDPERIARANIASGKANEEFSIEMMNSAVQWCIASIPVPSWAKKVFPDLSEEQAMEKLWEEDLQSGSHNRLRRCR